MKQMIQNRLRHAVQTLRPFLTPPDLQDQEENAIAKLLLQFMIPLAIIAPFFAVIAIISSPAFAARWIELVTYIWAMSTACFILIRSGRPRLAGYAVLSGFWLLVSLFTVSGGGLSAPIAVGYLALVIGAGLLLGAKAGYLMASVSILTELGIIWLGKTIPLPKVLIPRTDTLIWVIDSFHIAILAMLQHVASRNFRDALHSVDRELSLKKKTEQSLRQSEERFSRLSQATLEGIILSEGGTIVDANDQALKMFGYESEEMVGKNIVEFLEMSGIGRSRHHDTSDGEQPREYFASRKDGTTFPVETRSRSLIADGHEVSLTIARDITERRRAEVLQNAVYMISQAQNKSTSLDDLYSAVHDIVSTVMPANNFYIALYDRKDDAISFPYFADEKNESSGPNKTGKGLTEYVIRTGKSLMSDAATARELSEREDIELVGTPPAIWIGVPLNVEGVTIGVMAIQHYTDPDAYGERDLKMLEYVSEQVARAIDRKRADDASQRERILLRTLVDNLPLPIFVINKDSRRTLVNPAHLRRVRLATGRADLKSEVSILGKTDFDLYPRDWAEENLADIREVMGHGKQILEKEQFHIDSDGRPHWELMSKIPMRDESGDIIGLIGIGTDITERKLAEENLRQLNSFNEMLIQSFPFGIEIVDENGEILFLSEKMKTFQGLGTVGVRCWEVYRAGKTQCERCPLKREISIGASGSFEVTGFLGNRTFQINHTGLMYNGKKALIEIFQDITENKNLQTQFMQAQKLEGLGNIAAGVAHDFNNILAVILGYAELLKDSQHGPAKSESGFQAIVDSAQRGKSLVSQLLMFARKTETTFGAVQVNDVVKETERLLNATFPKTIQISTRHAHHLPHVTADRNQLHQVLLNICVNARDAMPGGGILAISTDVADVEAVAARHRGAAEDTYVKLEIRDTGTGMNAETKARIFEPFFSTKDIGKGTGLGLSVVYGIVESHRGFIEVDSELMKGTSITIYLPADEASAEPNPDKDKTNSHIRGGTETILVIEDEEMLRELLKSILTSKGYRVITATDGESGVEKFRAGNGRIAVVLSDLGLPRLSGQEVVGKIKKIHSDARVIVASGYISPDARSQLENLDVKTFIQKPYMTKEVLKAVRNTIDARE